VDTHVSLISNLISSKASRETTSRKDKFLWLLKKQNIFAIRIQFLKQKRVISSTKSFISQPSRKLLFTF
jgi:hypothetical protein